MCARGKLSECECVYKFFETLSLVSRFDQEKFKCALGVSVVYYHFSLPCKIYSSI